MASNKQFDTRVYFPGSSQYYLSQSKHEIENLMIGTDPKTYQKRLEDPRFANSTYIGEVEENEEI